MYRHEPREEEKDGSTRLLCVACHAVEYDLSDELAINSIREYKKRHPFPANWTDDDVVLTNSIGGKKSRPRRGVAWNLQERKGARKQIQPHQLK